MVTPPVLSRTSLRRRRRIGLILSQFVLLGVLIISSGFAWNNSRETLPRLPEFRNQPLEILPHYDDPRVVTNEQLLRVLSRLEPALGQSKPKINYVDHALRFWRAAIQFGDPNCVSGPRMRELLVDDSVLREAWGEETLPLLIPTDTGVAVRMQEGLASASHLDHTLATLAEVGTPLDYPLQTRQGSATVEDLLRHAVLNFSVNQSEYEWTSLALALYAPHAERWSTRERQSVDFNVLAHRLMRQRLAQGVCEGNHRLYTLVILLRVDDEHAILESATREEILAHLTDATRRLMATQSPEGYWEATWAGDETAGTTSNPADVQRERILATGHALEWWAMAPDSLHPSKESIARAGQWLVREIESMSPDSIRNQYTFLTHAGRALSLWRGEFPDEFMKRQSENKETL